ncbi:MAG: amidohydrolase family protein [Candidatus Edwardsbacteria bacterium]|nr:amidohydrolase family protein [Candidatus Edwardsbacteria bacterium]
MRTLVRNGTVYLEDKAFVTDVLVENGVIAGLEKIDYARGDGRVIDAQGMHVLPGLIDIHTHLDDAIGKYYLADNYTSGSEIAVTNGITTLCSFITQQRGGALREAVQRALEKAENKAYCDYAFHLTPSSFERADWTCIEKLLADGFRTFKFYTTYREAGLYLDYGKLRDAMARIREMGAKVLVHCEDDNLLSQARSKITDPSNPFSHALARPVEAEIEGIKRVLEIVEKIKCPCHIVHVSTAEGARLVGQARQDLAVTCETCPQYLFLNDDRLKQADGHRFICSPPLRSEKNRDKMWQLALLGTFDAYATDHCAFLEKDKNEEKADYAKVPNGLPGIGALVPLTYELHQDLSALARHLALNPAKIAGLYPKKGAIRKGSDADLVVLDTNGKERAIRSSLSEVYESYAGKTTKLEVKHVLLRGEMAVKDGCLCDRSMHFGKRV